jgi:hypothetical protein
MMQKKTVHSVTVSKAWLDKSTISIKYHGCSIAGNNVLRFFIDNIDYVSVYVVYIIYGFFNTSVCS